VILIIAVMVPAAIIGVLCAIAPAIAATEPEALEPEEDEK